MTLLATTNQKKHMRQKYLNACLGALVGLAGLALPNLQAQTFQDADVGTCTLAGSSTKSGTQITVKGGGADIWGTADAFHYYYTVKSGGFDVVVQVKDLQGPDGWTKAELMAREGNDDGAGGLVTEAGSRHASNMTTRSAGQNEIRAQYRFSTGGDSGEGVPSTTLRPSYPNTWLRLQRVGSVFNFFTSTDGKTWGTPYYTTDTATSSGGAFADTMCVGLAVTAHNDSDANGATAVFDNFQFLSPPPEVANINPANRTSYVAPPSSFSFNVTSLLGVAQSNLTVTLNGKDITSKLVLTGTANNRTVAYNGPFVANEIYNFVITVTDAGGTTVTSKVYWDTLSQDNYTIEAEDFNFESGKFFDSYELTSVESPDNYINKVGVENVDRVNPTEGSASHLYRTYDTATQVGETVGTEITGDFLRDKYSNAQLFDPAVNDYNVGWTDVGEWYNYTRTFTAGAYKIYPRIASGNTTMGGRVDLVTSSASAANQTVAPIGSFSAEGQGGWQNYIFAPVVDVNGNPVIYRLSGKQTLRVTSIAGANYNFYQLVPVANPGTLTPYVGAATPAANSSSATPDTAIIANIINRDTQVDAASVQMLVNGADVTSSAVKTTTTKGLDVKYTPAAFLTSGAQYSVTLIYADGATPANKVTNNWSFTIQAGVVTIPASYALPSNSGDTRGFTVRVLQSTTGENTTAWTETQLSGVNTYNAKGWQYADVINYWGSEGRGNFDNDTEFLPTFGLVDANYFALEAVAYLQLTRGVYTFGVNSDDGFRQMAGTNVQHVGVVIGEVSAGRGVANTDNSFTIEQDGLYPFRLTYEEGTGGYACEWYCYKNGVRMLINDPANANTVKAFRWSTAMPADYVSLAQQPPATKSVLLNKALELSVLPTAGAGTLTNTNRFVYQWYFNNQPIDATVNASAKTPTYKVAMAAATDVGTYKCQVMLLGYKPVFSANSVVTVVDDKVAPLMTNMVGSATLNTVTITYDEAMEPSSVTTAANYTGTGGLTISAVNPVMDSLGNVSKVILTTSAQTPGQKYTITVAGVTDLAGNPVASGTTGTFTAWVGDTGVAQIEYFRDIGSGTYVTDLTASDKYINNLPDEVVSISSLTTPSWENGTSYGGRITGIIVAPATGDYRFYLAADDYAEVWLSTDDQPNNWVGGAPIANIAGWSGQNQWSAPASQLSTTETTKQESDPITLTAGKKYYIMGLWKEGGGGDGCAIGWTTPSSSAITVVPASALFGYVNPDITSITITEQPVAVTVEQNRTATFKVVATATSMQGTNIVYQWQKNGANIVGATSATYTTPLAQLADNNAIFTCVLDVPGLTKTTAEAKLTVTADTTAATVASAGTLSASNYVGVLFSERMDKTSVENIAAYQVTGAAVQSAALATNQVVVLLKLDKAVASGATVQVTSVKDLAGNVGNGTVSVAINALLSRDIGTVNTNGVFTNPVWPGSAIAFANGGFEIQASGSDIWGTVDAFHYVYQEVTGDFDASVRIADLQGVNWWTKAGLMVREDLDANSAELFVVATPANGENAFQAAGRATKGGDSTEIGDRVRPVAYPNGWMRVQRTNSVLSLYASTNGTDWVSMITNTAVASLPLPSKLYVGICVTGHDNSGTNNTTAMFHDFKLTTSGTPAEAPELTVVRSKPNIVISWDAALGAGYKMYGSDKVNGTWTEITEAITTSAGVSSVTVNASTGAKYFKLAK